MRPVLSDGAQPADVISIEAASMEAAACFQLLGIGSDLLSGLGEMTFESVDLAGSGKGRIPLGGKLRFGGGKPAREGLLGASTLR
jgi:hypothetical protein